MAIGQFFYEHRTRIVASAGILCAWITQPYNQLYVTQWLFPASMPAMPWGGPHGMAGIVKVGLWIASKLFFAGGRLAIFLRCLFITFSSSSGGCFCFFLF